MADLDKIRVLLFLLILLWVEKLEDGNEIGENEFVKLGENKEDR